MTLVNAPWERYRDRLLPLIARTARRNHHEFSEQVDRALSDKTAFLFLCEDGFVVLEPQYRGPVIWVNVLFAYGWGENTIQRYQHQIEHLARQIGGRGVELITAVTALEPRLLQQGYTKVSGDEQIQHWEKAL